MIDPVLLKEDEYLVPGKKHGAEIKVKGSRFLCRIVPCSSKNAADEAYNQIKKQYYDATHNCFAWRIDMQNFRFSDDGEPSGTAGKPILQAIDSKQLYEILCVVTRYFGGTKLGTGGLIRAYGDCAAQALKECPVKVKTHWVEIRLEYDYSLENIVRNLTSEFGGKILKSDYNEGVEMNLALPQSLLEQFKSKINEKTNSLLKIN